MAVGAVAILFLNIVGQIAISCQTTATFPRKKPFAFWGAKGLLIDLPEKLLLKMCRKGAGLFPEFAEIDSTSIPPSFDTSCQGNRIKKDGGQNLFFLLGKEVAQ